jgi:hypothetical protein
MRNGSSRTLLHFTTLAIVVIVSFFVGMKIGEIKGYMMASYDMSGMRYQTMMRRELNDDRVMDTATVEPIAVPAVAIPKQ